MIFNFGKLQFYDEESDWHAFFFYSKGTDMYFQFVNKLYSQLTLCDDHVRSTALFRSCEICTSDATLGGCWEQMRVIQLMQMKPRKLDIQT